MKSIKFTDSNGIKWEVWVRSWYQDKIKTAVQLKEFKQKAANEQRMKGRNSWADTIENQTIIRWSIDSGIFSKLKRM